LYARQGVHITGFGSEEFDKSVAAIKHMQNMFLSGFARGFVEDWHAPMYDDYPMLCASNRYFTRRNLAPGQALVPYEFDVDPDNQLFRAACLSRVPLVTVAENKVLYYRRVASDDGKKM
jgi:hypothetical protein